MMDGPLVANKEAAGAALSLLPVVLTKPCLMRARLGSAAGPSPGLSGSRLVLGGREEGGSVTAAVSA